MNTGVFRTGVNPTREVFLTGFFSRLEQFSPKERLLLKEAVKELDSTAKDRIARIALAFNKEIKEAVAMDAGNSKRLFDITNKGDGEIAFSDPNLCEGGSQTDSLEFACFNSSRSNSHLKNLNRAKGRFLSDPRAYGNCEDCEKPIPIERLEEVPQAKRCVACKNGSHSY